MDYDTIAAIFLTPGTEPVADPTVEATPARRLRDSCEAVATIGWWSRPAADAMTALGHGFFDGYVWGRAAALGADVATPVVVAAFGVFNPGLLGPVYEQARTVSSREAVLDARATGAAAGLRGAAPTTPLDRVERCADALFSAFDTLTPSPRPLFDALRALPVPTDPYGRLWRAAELVREHRGDGHLAASVSAGLDMAEMNVLTELWLGFPLGAYSGTRGFDASALSDAVAGLAERGWATDGALTAEGLAARAAIEAATDATQGQLVRALSNDLDQVVDTLTVVSAEILLAHAAPADPRKRAAG